MNFDHDLWYCLSMVNEGDKKDSGVVLRLHDPMFSEDDSEKPTLRPTRQQEDAILNDMTLDELVAYLLAREPS